MKRLFLLTAMAIFMIWGCSPDMKETTGKPVVVLPEGPVVLEDTQFGMYYGNLNYEGIGRFSVVLSNARCYQDELNKPYMDSEGDMLVLQFRTELLPEGEAIALPEGDYAVSSGDELGVIDASTSYVTRFEGNMQSKWNLESGSFSVRKNADGVYEISTEDLVISKGEQKETVAYVFKSSLALADYQEMAPSLMSTTDDIINMPFPELECIYNGDLFGNGTGNFIVNIWTKNFIVDGQMMDVPGIYITMNFFSRLYSGASDPVLEEGRYTVTTSSETLLQRWSMLPGTYMETTPFGTYLLQIAGDKSETMEFIVSGVVDVKYDEVAVASKAGKARPCTITYSFKTSSRTISGVWKGDIVVDDQAGTSNESFLTTLDHDVECDMSKITEGTLTMIETLHRDNVEAEWDYDIAEAWQLKLEPRNWTDEEYSIPWIDPENQNGADGIPGTEDDWMYDKNGNGIRDRLEAYCGDGDAMFLEFILPLGSEGVIAPELNKTYTYTMQPNLSVQDANYEIYVSRMGRPADEIFDWRYARDHAGWAENLGIESYDRCNARRGFTWDTGDGLRGNWYVYYIKGQHLNIEGHAPAVNGWIKVTRTADDIYDLEWDFIDDNPGTPNKITGSMENVRVKTRK